MNFYYEILIEFKKIYNNFNYLQEIILHSKKLNLDFGCKINYRNNPNKKITSNSNM